MDGYKQQIRSEWDCLQMLVRSLAVMLLIPLAMAQIVNKGTVSKKGQWIWGAATASQFLPALPAIWIDNNELTCKPTCLWQTEPPCRRHASQLSCLRFADSAHDRLGQPHSQ